MISKAQCPYLQRASRRYAFFLSAMTCSQEIIGNTFTEEMSPQTVSVKTSMCFFLSSVHSKRPFYSKLIGYLEENLLADLTASILITFPN